MAPWLQFWKGPLLRESLGIVTRDAAVAAAQAINANFATAIGKMWDNDRGYSIANVKTLPSVSVTSSIVVTRSR